MNKKNTVITVLLVLVCAVLGYNLWKSASTPSPQELLRQKMAQAEDTFNNVAIDTVPGFKGSDRAGMYQYGEAGQQYVYQNYTVKVAKRTDNLAGEKIEITPSDGGAFWDVPVPEASKFIGVYRDYMMVEIAPTPNNRELLFVDMKQKRGAYKSPVIPVDTPAVMSGKLWFYAPIDTADMKKIPECPEKADWEAKGKKTMYGQKILYDFSNGAVTKKSEYKCYGQ
jgi:hypothetical protein